MLPRIAITALLTAGLLSGCGVIDDAKKEVSDSVRGQIAQECRKQARQIDDPETRRNVLEGCEAARTGDADTLRRKLKQECLKQARAISNAGERRQAQEHCREIDRR